MTDQTPLPYIHRRLARVPGAAEKARRALYGFGGILDEMDIEIVALLMSELIANSVQHAGPEAGDYVRVDVALAPGSIRVEVRDGGPGFVPAPRSLNPEDNGHWGISLVDKLADRWEVVPGAGKGDTLVWFELDRGRIRDSPNYW